MDAKQREAWNLRPMVVTVKERCDECGQLRYDVQKRTNYWPNITATCCAKCFAEMVGECSGVAV